MEAKKDIEQELAKSLKRLTVKEPFEKITIKQITDGAGVIRVTFYNHFQDKYDLLEWIVRQEVLEPVGILMNNRMYREAVILIFSNMKKDQEFYTHAARIEGQNSFEEIGRNATRDFLKGLFTKLGIKKKNPKHPWLTPDIIADYYSQSMMFIVMKWINTGMKVSPEEMEQVYEFMVTRSMWDTIEELQK